MKAQLTFDLDDYDDKIAHLRCVQASEICSILSDFMNNTSEEVTAEAIKHQLDIDDAIHSVYNKLWTMLDGRNIDIVKLIG
jgi:hypothetical protein